MDPKSIAQQLYALRPGRFMAARKEYVEQAKRAGDKQAAAAIGKMRKPSQAAWALNLLAREQPEELQRLANLGSALRDAHYRMDGDALLDLTRQRHRLLRAMVQQVKRLARAEGYPVTEPRELEAVFAAALADPAAAETLRSGTLWATSQVTEQQSWPEVTDQPVDEVGQRRERRAEQRRREIGLARAAVSRDIELRDRSLAKLGDAERRAGKLARRVTELEAELAKLREAQQEVEQEIDLYREFYRSAEEDLERHRKELADLGDPP